MKKGRFLVAFLTIGALFAGGLAANPASAEIPSITIWVDAPRLPGAQAYAKAMKGKVNAKVELHDQADMLRKVNLFNRVKKGWPDVVFGPPNDVGPLMDASYALPLNKLMPDSFWKDVEPFNGWCKLNTGEYMCVKDDIAQSVLWVNTKLMKDFGYTVPKTMKEFAAIGADIAANHKGYSLGALGDLGMYSSYLWPSQCPLNEARSGELVRIAPKSPKCTRVAALLQPMVDSGVLSTSAAWDADFLEEFAKPNKVVMTLGPSWFGEYIIRPASSWNVPAGQMTAEEMPMWEGEKVNYSGEWGGGIYTVSRHSKYPKVAMDFIKFMISDKRVIVDAKNPDGSTGVVTYPASLKGVALWQAKLSKDPYYAKNPIPALNAAGKKIYLGEKFVSYDSWGTMQGAFGADFKKNKDVQAAIDAAAKTLSSLAEKLGYKVITS